MIKKVNSEQEPCLSSRQFLLFSTKKSEHRIPSRMAKKLFFPGDRVEGKATFLHKTLCYSADVIELARFPSTSLSSYGFFIHFPLCCVASLKMVSCCVQFSVLPGKCFVILLLFFPLSRSSSKPGLRPRMSSRLNAHCDAIRRNEVIQRSRWAFFCRCLPLGLSLTDAGG